MESGPRPLFFWPSRRIRPPQSPSVFCPCFVEQVSSEAKGRVRLSIRAESKGASRLWLVLSAGGRRSKRTMCEQVDAEQRLHRGHQRQPRHHPTMALEQERRRGRH